MNDRHTRLCRLGIEVEPSSHMHKALLLCHKICNRDGRRHTGGETISELSIRVWDELRVVRDILVAFGVCTSYMPVSRGIFEVQM